MRSTSNLSASSLPLSEVYRLEDRRRRYLRQPAEWITDELGGFLWSKQRAIADSVVAHRRTAVHSCHDAGKSYIASRLACWWLSTSPVGSAFVVSTAPTWPQVRAILWREINRAHAQSNLPGRVNQTEWFMPTKTGAEELVGFGRRPRDMDVAAFQGIHAERVLVIFDEAAGITSKLLWDAADSLITNEQSRMLVIGNPDEPASPFAEVCKPGSGWNVIHIDGLATPNFTKERVPESLRPLLISPLWVDEKRKSWGESNPIYIAKVRGRFPEFSTDGLIPPAWVKAAQERTLAPTGPVELGVDVGGGGSGKSVIAKRAGGHVRVISSTNTPDTMETLGHVVQALVEESAKIARVDQIGIGRGIVDNAGHLPGKPPIVGIDVGERASDRERFANLRAELYWGLRERFQDGDIDLDPDDDELAAQLIAMKYKTTPRGQILIESKRDMIARGVASPDRADAVALAFAADVEQSLTVERILAG